MHRVYLIILLLLGCAAHECGAHSGFRDPLFPSRFGALVYACACMLFGAVLVVVCVGDVLVVGREAILDVASQVWEECFSHFLDKHWGHCLAHLACWAWRCKLASKRWAGAALVF